MRHQACLASVAPPAFLAPNAASLMEDSWSRASAVSVKTESKGSRAVSPTSSQGKCGATSRLPRFTGF